MTPSGKRQQVLLGTGRHPGRNTWATVPGTPGLRQYREVVMFSRTAATVASAFALMLIGGCASSTAPLGDGATSTTGPSGGGATPTSTPFDEGAGMRTLAKVEGWRPGFDRTSIPSEDRFAALELAYDEASVGALWSAVVPEGLSAAAGVPRSFGIYGAVEDVDFDEHVVGLWSSGQSSSCPNWLGSVHRDQEKVALVGVAIRGICTADYAAYSQIVVLDRDQVPAREALPVDGDFTSSDFADPTRPPGDGPVSKVLITAFVG